MPTNGDTRVTLALEQADVRDFIRWAGQEIGRNIIVHPNVRGEVTVLAGDKLSRDEAYGVFLSTLQVHGFAVVESDSALKVIPTDDATSMYAPISESGAEGFFDDIVVQVIRLKHVDATEVISLVQPMLTASAFVQAPTKGNLLIVGDRRGNIERVVTLIRNIDQSGIAEIRSLPLKFASAIEIASQIRQLLPDLTAIEGKNRINLLADVRTNTLLVSGESGILNQVQGLVKQLDQPVITDSLTRVVAIEYLDANDLVQPLSRVAESLHAIGGDDGARNTVSITVSEPNNALIITADANVFATLNSVIHQLDVRRSQVLVEAIIVEVAAEKALDLGINWRTEVPEGDGVFAGGSFSGNTLNPVPPALGPGLTLGFFSSGDLRAMIRAIASDSDTNFLSTPTLVMLDNHEAEILVGENIPLITGSSTGAASSTDNPFQTIQRQDIGITLKVIPRVNTDNSMTLNVIQTVENVSPTTLVASDIVTSKRQISTTVLIEDDEVLVLGGLIRDELNQTVSKVPLLGDIPLIGQAFRSTSEEVVKRNLMVFLHPRILHRREDNVEVTTKYTRGIDASRAEFLNSTNSFLFPKTLPTLPEPAEAAPANSLEGNDLP